MITAGLLQLVLGYLSQSSSESITAAVPLVERTATLFRLELLSVSVVRQALGVVFTFGACCRVWKKGSWSSKNKVFDSSVIHLALAVKI